MHGEVIEHYKDEHGRFIFAYNEGLAEAADKGFAQVGRGSLGVYAGKDEILYLPPDAIRDDPDAMRMVRQYKPKTEFVITFFENGSIHSYRLPKRITKQPKTASDPAE